VLFTLELHPCPACLLPFQDPEHSVRGVAAFALGQMSEFMADEMVGGAHTHRWHDNNRPSSSRALSPCAGSAAAVWECLLHVMQMVQGSWLIC
jgi:hypothetical protein